MNQNFVYFGNPGSDAASILQILSEVGLTPKRMQASSEAAKEIAASAPVAIMLGEGIEDSETFIATLREEQSLFTVPILASVSAPDAEALEEAFRIGIDDYVVQGSTKQFRALLSTLTDEDSWGAVRAPAGKVILAHADRSERVRLGKVLRRNGYDTFFAANTNELENAVKSVDARAVVASAELPEDNVIEVMGEVTDNMASPPPWVLIAPNKEVAQLASIAPASTQTSFFETGSDAEGLTFVMNEMLAPPPAGVRKSARILYNTPVQFRPEDGDTPFWGYSFNVSLGGLYVRSLAGLPLQTRTVVEFRPPHGRGLVVAIAQVVWTKKPGDTGGNASPPGMGIQFLDMWPADTAAFEAGYDILKKVPPRRSCSLGIPLQ